MRGQRRAEVVGQPLIRGSLSPVIARLGAAWKDRAYKAARRVGTAVAALSPAPQPTGVRTRPSAGRPGRASHLTIVPDTDDTTAWSQDDDEDGTTSPSYPGS